MAGALVGAWIGFNTTTGLLAVVTTIAGAVVGVNLDHHVNVIKTRGSERAVLPNTDPRKQTYTEQQLAWIVD